MRGEKGNNSSNPPLKHIRLRQSIPMKLSCPSENNSKRKTFPKMKEKDLYFLIFSLCNLVLFFYFAMREILYMREREGETFSSSTMIISLDVARSTGRERKNGIQSEMQTKGKRRSS